MQQKEMEPVVYRNFLRILLTILAAFVATAAAKPVTVTADVGFRWDFMQIMNSSSAPINETSDSSWLNKFWITNIKSSLLIKSRIGENVTAFIKLYALAQFTVPFNNNNMVQQRSGGGGLDEALATYRFGAADSLSPALTIGKFCFDYTREWQRLGGYLFRTGVYPGYILSTYIDNRIMGGYLSVRLPTTLTHRLFVTVEYEQKPLNDITLTYLGEMESAGARLSAACMLHRLLRTDQGYYMYSAGSPMIAIEEWSDGGKKKYYPRAGVKLVGRILYDFQTLIKSARLGANDLQIYVEAALLGAQNFPGYYNKITERVPVMAGITLPAFKVLDLAGVEVEWYGSRWRNNPSWLGVPVPKETYIARPDGAGYVFVENPATEDAGPKSKEDNIKWAVFVQKDVKNISLGLHAASDHFRAPQDIGYQQRELLLTPREWYWQATLHTRF